VPAGADVEATTGASAFHLPVPFDPARSSLNLDAIQLKQQTPLLYVIIEQYACESSLPPGSFKLNQQTQYRHRQPSAYLSGETSQFPSVYYNDDCETPDDSLLSIKHPKCRTATALPGILLYVIASRQKDVTSARLSARGLCHPSVLKSSQVRYICAALNHSYSLKGLYGPYIYDTPNPSPPETQDISRKKP